MIHVSNLIFEYPGFRALNDLGFHIPRGSITALVGPNGAGKTTLLRSMVALEQPVSGEIRINGIDVLEHPRECHRIIGFLSDFFGLYERLTVYQCLHYVARAQGLKDEACTSAISKVSQDLSLSRYMNTRTGELSRGLRQRVAIAQAIIHSPRVVLLDEPASGLDPDARHELARLFLSLQKQGMTLLVSSHILAELDTYCTDMLVLRQGVIVEHVSIKNQMQTQIFNLILAHPVTNLSEVLQQIDNIDILKIENQQQALLHLQADSNTQHEVLKNLLALGLPVCEFSKTANDLQHAYLKTIRSIS